MTVQFTVASRTRSTTSSNLPCLVNARTHIQWISNEKRNWRSIISARSSRYYLCAGDHAGAQSIFDSELGMYSVFENGLI